MNFITDPAEIEKRSFEIITDYLESDKTGGKHIDPKYSNVIKRVIHTTADFDYADNLVFSDGVIEKAKDALRCRARIVTDTQMAKAGINKKAAAKLGLEVHCFIGDPVVEKAALESGMTRAWTAVNHAASVLENPVIFAIGNAPTALIRLYELIKKDGFSPALIIAAPVGFVNVVESKELILGLDIPYIVAKGRKGGSNVAAAICNALIYETTERH